MSEHKVKTIYDFVNNKKISITVKPNSTPIDTLSEDSFTVKFHPYGSIEQYNYKVEDIIPISELPDDQNADSHFYQHNTKPSEQVYSLLKPTVNKGKNVIDEIADDNIVMGIKPNIESIFYSSTDLKNIGEKFGIIYKNDLYEKIINNIKMSNLNLQSDYYVESVNKKRIHQDNTLIIKGKVVQQEETMSYSEVGDKGSGSEYFLSGIQYSTPELFNIDYYNHILIPTYSKVVSNSDTSKLAGIIVKSKTAVDVVHELYAKRFLTKTIDEMNYEYVFLGENPLISAIHKSTKLTIPFGINLENYRIIVQTKNDKQIYSASICNYIDSTTSNEVECEIIDITEYKYISDLKIYDVGNGDPIEFYRPSSLIRERVEDVIQVKFQGMNCHYICSQGLGRFDSLINMFVNLDTMMLKTKLLKDLSAISAEEKKKYQTVHGSGLFNLSQIRGAEQIEGADKNLSVQNAGETFDVTERLQSKILKIKSATSIETHTPLGKNKSINVVKSTKETPIAQDFDTQNYIGGALQAQTLVQPNVIAKETRGNGIIKNMQIDGVFPNKGEFNIVCDNLYEQNQKLSTISTVVKGLIEPKIIINFGDSSKIKIDKITYDHQSNGTVFEYIGLID